MCGERKTPGRPGGCRAEGRVETEGQAGARSMRKRSFRRHREPANGDNVELLEKVLSIDNMFDACGRVVRNGGSAGVDGMTVEELQPYLIQHYRELVESIRGGWYQPKPVKRVEIPKPDGGKRQLGVPTVIDRMVQQALVQVLQPVFEATFSDSSYGFRPKRSAHQAIEQARRYGEEGNTWVVDLGLEKYFDTVNHDVLIKLVREVIKDEAVIALIKKFLKSGVMADGLVSQSEQGTPQGGNLSPLLSNVYLTKFDRMLEERGHKFVRYADDADQRSDNIYVKSRRAAERVMKGCIEYLEGKLKVNRKKSTVGNPAKLKFLGFSLYRSKERVRIRVHENSLERLKERLKALTSRKRSGTIERILRELITLLTGWAGYYRIAGMKKYLERVGEWLRRRIRQMYWKRVWTRYEHLLQRGVPREKAWQWANTRKGCWRIAGSCLLTTTLTNGYLAAKRFPNMVKRYEALRATDQRLQLLHATH
jgi:group II intron reverse transcriptase/maturase